MMYEELPDDIRNIVDPTVTMNESFVVIPLRYMKAIKPIGSATLMAWFVFWARRHEIDGGFMEIPMKDVENSLGIGRKSYTNIRSKLLSARLIQVMDRPGQSSWIKVNYEALASRLDPEYQPRPLKGTGSGSEPRPLKGTGSPRPLKGTGSTSIVNNSGSNGALFGESEQEIDLKLGFLPERDKQKQEPIRRTLTAIGGKALRRGDVISVWRETLRRGGRKHVPTQAEKRILESVRDQHGIVKLAAACYITASFGGSVASVEEVIRGWFDGSDPSGQGPSYEYPIVIDEHDPDYAEGIERLIRLGYGPTDRYLKHHVSDAPADIRKILDGWGL